MNKKFLLIATSASLILLVLIIVLTPKKNVNPQPSSDSNIEISRTELIDLSKTKREEAKQYIASIEKKLPIYLDKFTTSVGITTSINIYRVRDDEPEIIRLEIYGLSYLNHDANEKTNPNLTAFKESYKKAMEMIEGQNIDPKKLIFVYGDKQYVRETSNIWIESLKLHP